MTPDALARLHGLSFTWPRPWTTQEFARLLDSHLVFVVGDDRAFAVGRVIVDEAELLTIATDPALRRQGLGRATLGAFHEAAAARGAATVFLEVAADNTAARALYCSLGYTRTGLRPGYYRPPGSPAIDALLMSRPLP